MSVSSQLTVHSLAVRAVHVPMRLPLQTSSGTIRVAPLCLIDLRTEEGVVGHTYLFCYTPLVLKPVCELLMNLDPLLRGVSAAPLEINRLLRARFRLLGDSGIVGMALAGIDMAAWDALARAEGRPLARALGADVMAIPAYNSCGLGLIGPEAAPAEAEALVAEGFSAIKVRLGYPDLATDLRVVRAVKAAIGPDVYLMSDYNQGLSVPEAERRVLVLADEGLTWIEEPCLAHDYAGCARVRARSTCPIQIGENWWGPREMADSLAAGASDLGMPDAMKIGGVSGWLQAAALAEAAGLPLSTHLFPEVSVHLMAATPTRHWLEYVDWASPVLAEPVRVRDGKVSVPDRAGTGIEWDEAAVARCLAP
ncbi:enolase C-terminal domain-like protein [Hydrogenophaga intermedia]|jgi:mandelate racemase|uniref:enolase C-terminal domain-like protein n=1 Tax=Hydrogenophaga intermedia TaxID=65786 RepID=UPI0020436A8D|nr:enolase C-terminal domain-like protein [Hydrogenophaga intermedia]MCM3563063.1 mandelate racemase [Hydrogenophaga intermedia]